jgi:hypothetical protein
VLLCSCMVEACGRTADRHTADHAA